MGRTGFQDFFGGIAFSALIAFFFPAPGQAQDSMDHAIRVDPLRLTAGTFQVEYEHEVGDGFTLSFMPMGTFVAENGMGGWYLESMGRRKSEANDATYKVKSVSGFGFDLQARQYYHAHEDVPSGLYYAPHFTYRNLNVFSELSNKTKNTGIEEEKNRKLNVFSFGLVAGAQLPIATKHFAFDVYGGPVFRASSYSDESGLSKYNAWTGLDHTGVTLTVGVSIGLLK